MLIALVLALTALPPVQRGSTVAVDPSGRGSWVVDEETDSVLLIPKQGEPHKVAVGRWPERLVAESGGRLFVSCRQDGEIDVIASDFSVTRIAVGVEPSALYLDETHHRLFAGLVTARQVVAIDTGSLKIVARRQLDLEPAAIELTRDGLAVLAKRGGEVGFLTPELDGDWWVALQRTEAGSRPWQGLAMAQVGEDLMVVHTVEETGLAQVGFSDGYGGGAAAEPVATFVSVLRHAKPLRMIEERPMLDVTGITVDHNRVALSVRGADAVLIGTWNPRAEILDMRSVEVGAGLSGVAFESDTSVIALAAFDRKLVRTGVRREYPEAERARALIRRADPKQKATLFGILGSGFGGFDMGRGGEGFFESRMLPGPALSESLTLVVAQKTALPAGRYDAELALGRRLFHSTTNGQISSNSLGCVSCHPDGREDGLVWRLQGTRRQTPLLAGRLQETAPYNWKGTGKTLEQNVGHTTERLGGTGLSPASRKALARYLVEGLRPVAAPRVEEAARVARGGEVFHDPSVGCATCHPSDDGFTDGAMHDVASVGVKETAEMREAGTFGKDARQFDSPDLRKLAITAPYFHDGSRPTLEALLEENHDQMGHTSGLTAEDRAALVAYLRSL